MKKAIGILLVCLLVLSAFFLGKSMGRTEKAVPTAEETQPVGSALKISVVEDPEAGWTTLLSDNTSNMVDRNTQNTFISAIVES